MALMPMFWGREAILNAWIRLEGGNGRVGGELHEEGKFGWRAVVVVEVVGWISVEGPNPKMLVPRFLIVFHRRFLRSPPSRPLGSVSPLFNRDPISQH